MTVIDPDVRRRFGAWRIDTLLEKHELYMRWNDLLSDPDSVSLLTIRGQEMLIPYSPAERDRYVVVRAALDPIGELATVFLAREPQQADNAWEWEEGVVLIGRKVPETELYVTVVWHDWYASTRGILIDGEDRPTFPR